MSIHKHPFLSRDTRRGQAAPWRAEIARTINEWRLRSTHTQGCVQKQNRSTEGCSKLKRSVDMTSSAKNCLNKCKSQIGQDQVSGGVSVLCWLAATVAMFYGNLPKFGNKVNIGNKVQFGKGSQIGVLSISWGCHCRWLCPRMTCNIC